MSTNLASISNVSVTIPDHVLFQQLEGESVLLDVRSGGYYGLNEVGTYVWQRLGDGMQLAEIITTMCTDYDVSEARASQDARQFLSALHSQGLVYVDEQGS